MMELLSSKNASIARNLLRHIADSILTLRERTSVINSAQDFLLSPENMEKLDAACMQVMVIGECVVKLDKVLNGALADLEPSIPWGAIKGVRNFIAHGYFEIDEEEIFKIIKTDLTPLHEAVGRLLERSFV